MSDPDLDFGAVADPARAAILRDWTERHPDTIGALVELDRLGFGLRDLTCYVEVQAQSVEHAQEVHDLARDVVARSLDRHRTAYRKHLAEHVLADLAEAGLVVVTMDQLPEFAAGRAPLAVDPAHD